MGRTTLTSSTASTSKSGTFPAKAVARNPRRHNSAHTRYSPACFVSWICLPVAIVSLIDPYRMPTSSRLPFRGLSSYGAESCSAPLHPLQRFHLIGCQWRLRFIHAPDVPGAPQEEGVNDRGSRRFPPRD